jgi:hypothetical protein
VGEDRVIEVRELGSYASLNAADKLMAAVSQALAGFVTYENRRHRRIYLYEACFYAPVIDVANARNWRVEHEYKIVDNVDGLFGKEIDFVLSKRAVKCIVEMKYFRSQSAAASSLVNIQGDLNKLNHFDLGHMNNLVMIGGYVVLIGKRGLLRKAFGSKPRDQNRQQLYEKARFLLEDNRQDRFYECGWRCDEVGQDNEKLDKNAVLTLRVRNEKRQ